MTKRGVKELYMWLTASWPLIIKPGASEAFQSAKLAELYETFKSYTDEQVLAAFHKWTAENDRFPTTKNIINEIEWARANRLRRDTGELYMMERIDDDGTEWVVEHGGKIMFTWNEFLQLPANPEHLDPKEWARRYEARRRQVIENMRART
jgi:hypothetical protein